MQKRMIKTLRGMDMQAYGVIVDRSEYQKVAADIRPNQKLRDPWYLAFEGGIAAMMKGSAEAGKKHGITFVFDRQEKKFALRAHGLYNELIASDLPFADRLGTLSFSPKDKVAALQAIDVITYEVNRGFEDERKALDSRWQFELITKLVRTKMTVFNAAKFQEFVEDRKESAASG